MPNVPLTHALSRLFALLAVAIACLFPTFVHAELYPGADEALEQTTGANARRNAAEYEARQQAAAAAQRINQAQEQAVDKLSTVLSTLNAAIAAKVGIFTAQGNQLVAALGVMAFSWLGIRTMLQGSSFAEAISEAVMLFFIVGMASWAVNAESLGRAIQAGFDMITAKILTSAGYGAVDDGVKSALKTFLGTILEMYEQPTGASFMAISSWVPAAGIVLTKLFMALFLLAAALAYIAMYIMTQVMFGIGLVLAPLLIPFYIIQPLSFLAMGWFKFMISAGLAKVTGALILSLTLGMTNGLTELVRNTSLENGVPFGLYSITFLIVGIMAVMMMQAWSIGTSILTGVSRMGSGLPNKLQPGGMSTAASTSLQKGAGSAAVGAGAAAGGVIGGAAGAFSHAIGGGAEAGARNQGVASGSGSALNAAGGETAGKSSMLQSIRSGAAAGEEKGRQFMSKPLSTLKEAVLGKAGGSSGGTGGAGGSNKSSGTRASAPSQGMAPASGGAQPQGAQSQSLAQSGGGAGGQGHSASTQAPVTQGASSQARGGSSSGGSAPASSSAGSAPRSPSAAMKSGPAMGQAPSSQVGGQPRAPKQGPAASVSSGAQRGPTIQGASATRTAGSSGGRAPVSNSAPTTSPRSGTTPRSSSYRPSPQQSSRPTQALYTRVARGSRSNTNRASTEGRKG